jgi:Zn-dependent protease with chaperone function
MRRHALSLVLVAGLVPSARSAEVKEEKADGYLEWRDGAILVADGQRIRLTAATKYKGKAEAKDPANIPLGYELKAKGLRDDLGVLVARELEAKPNGSAMFEGEVREATDAAEQRSVQAGRFLESEDPRGGGVGRLYTDGPEVERVRRIVNELSPPYLDPESFRVYVIDNKEWNAFAMGNYSIYVFSGLLKDMDDDEVAMVLGHEMVHATHEHTRRQFKKQMWIQLAALGLAGIEEATIENDKARAVAQLATLFAATAAGNGYGRDLEDQADRVGLRYAYEAGYDITKGPRLWNRFAKKYGESGKLANFFFSDHSLSSARAANLEKQIAFNYPEGPKRVDRAPAPAPAAPASASPAATVTVSTRPPSAAPPAPPDPGSSRALAGAPAAPVTAAPASGSKEIKPGMTTAEVQRLLGAPREQLSFGSQTKWVYPSVSVIFEGGKVKEVRF